MMVHSIIRLRRLLRLIRCDMRITSNRNSSSVIKPQNILHLHKRGLLEDIFPAATTALPDELLTRQCFYCGFDPTSDSLHVGNLMSLMLLLHCQRAGHDAIAVIGDATARIGDPSDQTKDRKRLSDETIDRNSTGIENCITKLFETHEREIYVNRGVKRLPKLKILRNYDWYRTFNVIDFMSQEGRTFRMGAMLDKRFVRERLDSEEGLLLPEFLYQVFQAYDWYYLYKKYNCRFQFGGGDQLGNITSGRRLIDRLTGGDVYGLMTPIVTTPSGQKIGKSAGNAVWLDADKTSPFELYQYFLRQRDSDVERFLKFFTFIELGAIHEIMEEHRKHPEKRNAQKVLARNVCKLLHGEHGLKSAERIKRFFGTVEMIYKDLASLVLGVNVDLSIMKSRCTDVLYRGSLEHLEALTDEEVDATFKGMKIHHAILEPDTTIYDIALKIKAIPEGSIGMETIRNGGVTVNGIRMKAAEQIMLSDFHVLKNDMSLITVGKKSHYLVRWRIPDRRCESR